MDIQLSQFDELQELGQDLMLYVGEEARNNLTEQLTDLQERWDSLVHQMDHHTKQVSICCWAVLM